MSDREGGRQDGSHGGAGGGERETGLQPGRRTVNWLIINHNPCPFLTLHLINGSLIFFFSLILPQALL